MDKEELKDKIEEKIMSLKESLVDKWNRLAKKKIYINDSFEIGVGRLVFSGIIFGVQVLWGFLAGATAVEMMPSLLTWLVSLKQAEKKNIN